MVIEQGLDARVVPRLVWVTDAWFSVPLTLPETPRCVLGCNVARVDLLLRPPEPSATPATLRMLVSDVATEHRYECHSPRHLDGQPSQHLFLNPCSPLSLVPAFGQAPFRFLGKAICAAPHLFSPWAMKSVVADALLVSDVWRLPKSLDNFDNACTIGRPLLGTSKREVDRAIKVNLVFLDEFSECRLRTWRRHGRNRVRCARRGRV